MNPALAASLYALVEVRAKRRQRNKLRAAGTIRHVGATKAGRWEVLR